jgi:hypothetical protein
MNFKAIVSIQYSDLFEASDKLEISEYLRDIPSKNSLEIICHYQTQVYLNFIDNNLQIGLLNEWSANFSNELKLEISKFIERNLRRGNHFSFITNAACLRLIDSIFDNYNDLDYQENINEDLILNLFKAYLICAQEIIEIQKFPTEKVTDANSLIKLILPIQIPYVEINEVTDFRIQFLKSVYFFKFCENDNQFSQFLNIFLNERNVDNWRRYLYNLLSTYVRDLTPGNIPSFLNIEDNQFEEIINWLETLEIDPSNYTSNQDFLDIRNKPIYKFADNRFLFLNLNFFVDKIFQGIQFDIAQALIERETEYNGRRIRTIPQFRSIFSDLFSERELFYKVLRYAFGTNGYKMFDGNELAEIFNNGEPDFYIRDKSKVYIFEFKDILISSNVKYSNDYDQIKEDLFRKLVRNDQGHAKGVTQLMNVIEKIIDGEMNDHDDFDFSKAIYYPIIVYTDFSLNTRGLNYLINHESYKIIEEKKLPSNRIKDTVLVDLDSLIKFQDLFRKKKITLNHSINEHIKFTHKPDLFDQISTYNQNLHFIASRFDQLNPEMLRNEFSVIFENQND